MLKRLEETMSDDATSGEPDTVNVSEPDAAAYWAQRFQVPVERVQEAVAAVGHDLERVAAHLGRPWPFEASGIV